MEEENKTEQQEPRTIACAVCKAGGMEILYIQSNQMFIRCLNPSCRATQSIMIFGSFITEDGDGEEE